MGNYGAPSRLMRWRSASRIHSARLWPGGTQASINLISAGGIGTGRRIMGCFLGGISQPPKSCVSWDPSNRTSIHTGAMRTSKGAVFLAAFSAARRAPAMSRNL